MMAMLADIGELLGGIGVIASLGYLAVQIRQNTKALQSESYHQSAEQMWTFCITTAESETLAEIIVRDAQGDELTPAERFRLMNSLSALLFGFENCVRLREQGLVDDAIWENLMENSTGPLRMFRRYIEARPGPLSAKLLAEIDSREPAYGAFDPASLVSG
jgi:hypothetical protein